MELVDSHCHIDFPPLNQDISGILARAATNQVGYMLCVSVNLEDFPGILDLANQYTNVFASVGVHPNEQQGREPTVDELVSLSRQSEKVIAMGETGLDYFRSTGDLKWQKDRFARHIDAAKQVNKPLIIHTRNAAVDTMAMLKDHHADEAGGVMHCFAQDWNCAQQALDLGFYISFSGIVTFKNAHEVKEVAQKTPLDRILVETDAPYLAPVPYRGKTNEPSYVRHTAEHVAELRGISPKSFAQATTENFFNLFHDARREATID